AYGRRSKELAAFIRSRTGLFLSYGELYGSGRDFLRMNIACPRAKVQEGLERLEKALSMI
ncbi:MAG: aminotransferase, partial [Schwartzia sp.]|nr:aminotransferase [Schwartzia sp. (in: firmicutes)]